MKKKFLKKERFNLLKNRIFIDKKETSSSKIINDLLKFDINSKKINLLKIQIYSKYLFLKKFIKNIINYDSQKNKNFLYTRRSMREKLGAGIQKNQILKYIKIAKKNDPKLKNIILKEFGPNGFFIYKSG